MPPATSGVEGKSSLLYAGDLGENNRFRSPTPPGTGREPRPGRRAYLCEASEPGLPDRKSTAGGNFFPRLRPVARLTAGPRRGELVDVWRAHSGGGSAAGAHFTAGLPHR